MAVSGSTDWTLDAEAIVLAAWRKVGERTPDTFKKNEALEALNAIVKELQSDNIFLWTVEWVQKTFSASSEVTGSDSLNYTCRRGHTSSANDKPITGANYTTYWEQAGDSGSAWVTSTAYSAVGDFAPDSDTLAVIQAFIRRDNADREVSIIGKQQYHELQDKNSDGQPLMLYLDTQLTPHIYLWPQPDDTTDVLHYFRVKKLQDYDAFTDTGDFRDSTARFLIYQLAYDLGDEVPEIDNIKHSRLGKKAKEAKKLLRKSNYPDDSEDFIRPCY